MLASVAIFLAAETRGLLIGERADPALIARLRGEVEADPDVRGIIRVRTMHVGTRHVVITMRVRFRDKPAMDVARLIERLEARLGALDDRLADLTIQPVP